jgi:glyoxylase-like metal-dependent hydrolase (beta-lactamase superfamily II)
MRPAYHWLDPLWARARLPYSTRVSTGYVGPVRSIRMVRSYWGREILPVHCFVVGDTLVDTGLSCAGEHIESFVRENGIRRAILTHHHEDHAGNAGRLARAGIHVLASRLAAPILRHGVPIRFYQHVLWGAAEAADAKILGASVQLGPYEAEVLDAPGHCADQVAFFVRSQGWLFSGDAFLGEKVKVFRRDEDFAATVATVERLLGCDFDVLLCAHRPRPQGGRAALSAKLQWLRDVEGRVRDLDAQGCAEREIASRLRVGRVSPFRFVTFGDVSTANVVRSILRGPTPRSELARAHFARGVAAAPEGGA